MLLSHVVSKVTSRHDRPLEVLNNFRLEFVLKDLKLNNSMVFYFVTTANNFSIVYSVTCRKLFSQIFL